MKVLLVNGSPHKEGCTHVALQEVAAVLEEQGIACEEFWLGKEAIMGCIACGQCKKTGRCFRDDAVNAFITAAEKADGFVFGSPVHFAAATGSIAAFLDRVFYAGKGVFAHKPGAAIVSCRRGGASAAFDQLIKYLTISQMIVVASQYWNSVHGNTPEEVRRDEEGLQTMRTLGRNMAWVLKAFDAARQSGINPPLQEAPVKTNFIR